MAVSKVSSFTKKSLFQFSLLHLPFQGAGGAGVPARKSIEVKIDSSTHLCARDYIRMWGEDWEEILDLIDTTFGENAGEEEEEEEEASYEDAD